MPKRVSLRERLLAKIAVNPVTGCWEWTASRNKAGYGYIGLCDGTTRPILAHRASWMLFRGELMPGLVIDHLCRNTSCINPDHLEQVAVRENVMRGLTGIRQTCRFGHPLDAIKNRGNRTSRACSTCIKARRSTPEGRRKDALKHRLARAIKRQSGI